MHEPGPVKSPFPFSFFLNALILCLIFTLIFLFVGGDSSILIQFPLIFAGLSLFFFVFAANRFELSDDEVIVYFWCLPFWKWRKKFSEIAEVNYHRMGNTPFNEVHFKIRKNGKWKTKGQTTANTQKSLRLFFAALAEKGIKVGEA